MQAEFKEIQIEELLASHEPYAAIHGRVLLYRIIFAFFGCLFVLLGLAICTKMASWDHQLFGSSHPYKVALAGGTFFFSCLSFATALALSPHREAARHTARPYLQKLAEMELSPQQHSTRKHKIASESHHTAKILKRISQSTHLPEPNRLALKNQALMQLRENLKGLCRSERHLQR